VLADEVKKSSSSVNAQSVKNHLRNYVNSVRALNSTPFSSSDFNSVNSAQYNVNCIRRKRQKIL